MSDKRKVIMNHEQSYWLHIQTDSMHGVDKLRPQPPKASQEKPPTSTPPVGSEGTGVGKQGNNDE
jgi:hypothetical protein